MARHPPHRQQALLSVFHQPPHCRRPGRPPLPPPPPPGAAAALRPATCASPRRETRRRAILMATRSRRMTPSRTSAGSRRRPRRARARPRSRMRSSRRSPSLRIRYAPRQRLTAPQRAPGPRATRAAPRGSSRPSASGRQQRTGSGRGGELWAQACRPHKPDSSSLHPSRCSSGMLDKRSTAPSMVPSAICWSQSRALTPNLRGYELGASNSWLLM